MQASDVASYASQAGFTGDALVTIVMVAGRESSYNENAVGDVGIETAVWGPSVGLYQIRTLKAQTGTGSDRDINALMPGGKGDPKRQSIAAWAISANGTNFSPWVNGSGQVPPAGFSASQQADARQAVTNAGSIHALPSAPGGGPGGSGGGGGLTGDITGAIDQALGAVVGADTFSGWIVEHAVRTVEVIGGAIVLAVAGLLLLDLMGSAPGTAGTSSSLIARTTRKARDTAATVAAIAAA